MKKKGELREGYIAKWRSYPKDEVKIRVARPHVLSPSKSLLRDFMTIKKDWLKTGMNEKDARRNAWNAVNYEARFRNEINANPQAQEIIDAIIDILNHGDNIRLICYEKEWPCHRFILLDIIQQKMKE